MREPNAKKTISNNANEGKINVEKKTEMKYAQLINLTTKH